MCVVKEEWGRSTYVFSEDILAYHAELEDLSSECQTEALFLVKRDELDDFQPPSVGAVVRESNAGHVG